MTYTATDQALKGALTHYGVKGMKWGVRKDRGGSGKTIQTQSAPKNQSSTKTKTDTPASAKPRTGRELYQVPSSELTPDELTNLREMRKESYLTFARYNSFTSEQKRRIDRDPEYLALGKDLPKSNHSPLAKYIAEEHPDGMKVSMEVADRLGFPHPNIPPEVMEKRLKAEEKGHDKYLLEERKRQRKAAHSDLPIDSELDDALIHYGVKGMKWDESKKGKRGKKDLRGTPTSGTVGDVIAKYDSTDGSTKKPSAYGARDLRSDADRFIGRIVDRENQKDPNFAKPRFKSDLTTKELIERSEERKRERERRQNKKKLEHSEITFGEILQHNELYSSNGSIDDYLMHYGVKGMKWGVRKDRGSSGKRKTTSAKSKSKSTDSELRDKVRSIASSVKKNLSAESINKRRVDRVKAKTKKAEAKAARAEEVRKAKEKLTAAKDRKNLAEGKPTTADKKATTTTATTKSSGTAGLTNDELKAKVERMELERRYAAAAAPATPAKKSSGIVSTFAKGAGSKLSTRLQAEVANRVFKALIGDDDKPKGKNKLGDVSAPKVSEHVKNITEAAKKKPSSTPPVTAMAMGLVGAASMAASANKNRSSQKATFSPRPSGFTDSFSDEIIDGFMNIKNTQYKTARDFNREIELYRRR